MNKKKSWRRRQRERASAQFDEVRAVFMLTDAALDWQRTILKLEAARRKRNKRKYGTGALGAVVGAPRLIKKA